MHCGTLRLGKIPAGCVLALSLTLIFASSSALAQQSSSNTSQPPAQADDYSFPADISQKAAAEKKNAEQPPSDDNGKTGSQTSNNQGKDESTPSGSSADDNAFPEETSRKAASTAKSDSSGSDPDVPTNPGVSSSSDYDRRTSGRNTVPVNVPMPHANGKDPVKDDINVGGYYLESGNFAGAYLRFKEASTLAPENANAIFGLAEAARHLKRRDEALTNYQFFLQIVDSGSKAKDARKAVASLEKAR